MLESTKGGKAPGASGADTGQAASRRVLERYTMAAYHLDITTSGLRTIVLDSAHDAHDFLWSDGATTWRLENLLDELDESLDEELHLEAADLSEQGQLAFIEGYCDAAPADYDAAADCEGPQPWCCPWYSSSRESWQAELMAKLEQTGGDIREAAKLFALEDYDELAEILAEESDD